MRTKIFVSAISLLAALGLSSCYTEFAATGNDEGYGYPSYSSGYYDSSYAGNGYDTTGAPIINNYNYYGYGYPSYYDDNWYTPSPWWWQNDLWFGFGGGYNSWYTGGFGWGTPYYAYNGYALGPYSRYGYSPFYPYGSGYYGYQTGGVNPTGRVRTIGDTRDGRESYGGGSTPIPWTSGAGAVSGTGNAGAGSAGSASRQPASTERTRSTGANVSPSSGVTQQPSNRTRDGGSSQQQPNSNTNSRPQSQPRVRDMGPSRSGDSGNSNSGARPRGAAYSGSISSSHRVMYRDIGNHIERQEFNLRDRCNMLKLHAPQVVSNRLLLCLQREVVDQHRAAAEQDVSQINLLEKPVLYLKSGFFGIS